MTAQEHLSQLIGGLVIQIATLQAELDRLTAEATCSTPPASSSSPASSA